MLLDVSDKSHEFLDLLNSFSDHNQADIFFLWSLSCNAEKTKQKHPDNDRYDCIVQPWQTRLWVTYFDAVQTSQVLFQFHTFSQTKHVPSLVTYEICVVPCLVLGHGPNVCTCSLMIFLSKIILFKQISVWSFILNKMGLQVQPASDNDETLNNHTLSDEIRTFSQDLADKVCGHLIASQKRQWEKVSLTLPSLTSGGGGQHLAWSWTTH